MLTHLKLQCSSMSNTPNINATSWKYNADSRYWRLFPFIHKQTVHNFIHGFIMVHIWLQHFAEVKPLIQLTQIWYFIESSKDLIYWHTVTILNYLCLFRLWIIKKKFYLEIYGKLDFDILEGLLIPHWCYRIVLCEIDLPWFHSGLICISYPAHLLQFMTVNGLWGSAGFNPFPYTDPIVFCTM